MNPLDLLHGEDPISVITALSMLAEQAGWKDVTDLLLEAERLWAERTND